MPDWNVVITARDQGFARAGELRAPSTRCFVSTDAAFCLRPGRPR
jgi:hypothetical protein